MLTPPLDVAADIATRQLDAVADCFRAPLYVTREFCVYATLPYAAAHIFALRHTLIPITLIYCFRLFTVTLNSMSCSCQAVVRRLPARRRHVFATLCFAARHAAIASSTEPR